MRILKLLTVTTTLCVVAWFTSGQSLNASEKNKKHYGYPDIVLDVRKVPKKERMYPGVVDAIMVPEKKNGAGVVLLASCTGIKSWNQEDLKDFAKELTSKGYTVAVPDYNSGTRPKHKPFNCGGNKNLKDMRLVKDVYDATKALASIPGVDSNRIFTIGQSLGAQIGADAISPNNARLANKYNWGPVPRAVVGLYGGCQYPRKTYLNGDIVRPVLWMAGEKDTFSYTKYGCSSWTISSVMKKQPDSKFIVYKDATHCFDCKQLDGFVNKREEQTYRYNETATKQSRDEIFRFIEKFK
jgi:dienelactone hydrolase